MAPPKTSAEGIESSALLTQPIPQPPAPPAISHSLLLLAKQWIVITLTLSAVAMIGCTSTSHAARALEQRRICLSNGETSHQLVVEVAKSLSDKKRGLQHRQDLAPDSGMLFVYQEDQSADNAFWMYRTPRPLAIAFIDRQGIIQTIHQMEPCTSPTAAKCPLYLAGKPFRYALEVNRDYFARHQIAPGHRVDLDSENNCD
jgi:hypothetical protein